MATTKKAKNKAQEVKGKTKKHIGRATGDRSMEARGRLDQAAGNLKQATEKARDAFRP
jgi:uncharacterized protein YjbJ (UPF0337 family)